MESNFLLIVLLTTILGIGEDHTLKVALLEPLRPINPEEPPENSGIISLLRKVFL